MADSERMESRSKDDRYYVRTNMWMELAYAQSTSRSLFPFGGSVGCEALIASIASIALMVKAEEGKNKNDWAIGMEQKLLVW